MALRFNTSEQALYDAAKNIAEIEIRRIRTPGGVIDPVMRHTHDRIRDTLNAHTAPREWLAVAIGTAEGQLTGMATPDALATEAIQRLRLQMEGLPEVVTPPPNNPVPPVGNTTTQPGLTQGVEQPGEGVAPERTEGSPERSFWQSAWDRISLKKERQDGWSSYKTWRERVNHKRNTRSEEPATVAPVIIAPSFNPEAYRASMGNGGFNYLYEAGMKRFRTPKPTPAPAVPAAPAQEAAPNRRAA